MRASRVLLLSPKGTAPQPAADLSGDLRLRQAVDGAQLEDRLLACRQGTECRGKRPSELDALVAGILAAEPVAERTRAGFLARARASSAADE